MNNWLKRISDHKRFISNPGSPFKFIYSPKVNKDGSIDLVVKEKTSLYDYIQSFKDSCDINVLIRRYQQGDTAALMRAQTMYGDFTEMPKTYAEFLQVAIDGENYFDTLPPEVRQKFDNNFAKFVAAIGSPEFLDALGIKSEQDVENSVENVEKVESEVNDAS